MVYRRVWQAAGMGKGYLCIGCLERRLCRRVVPEDFTKAPINRLHSWDTERLASRKRPAIP